MHARTLEKALQPAIAMRACSRGGNQTLRTKLAPPCCTVRGLHPAVHLVPPSSDACSEVTNKLVCLTTHLQVIVRGVVGGPVRLVQQPRMLQPLPQRLGALGAAIARRCREGQGVGRWVSKLCTSLSTAGRLG